MVLKPFRILYVIYACLLFVVLMIPVFIWSLAVLPFGAVRGGNLVYRACIAWADAWLLLIGIRHRNIRTGGDREAACIYVSNHISYLDSAVIPKAFRKPLRPLGKVEMSKIPIFGFIYRNAIVTVDRSSAAARARSVQQLKGILARGISILVFPEGTFNTTGQPLKSFYDGAFRIAVETGTPIVPVLLLDTYARMHYGSVFSLNPGRNRVVFLPAISVEGMGIDDVPALKEKVYRIMEAALLSYGADWIRPSLRAVQEAAGETNN